MTLFMQTAAFTLDLSLPQLHSQHGVYVPVFCDTGKTLLLHFLFLL